MTQYIVHIFREMRVTFAGIEADTPEAAAAIARDMTTDQADDIEDCNGDDLSALVDIAGDEEYAQSRFIDFAPERLLKAASQILAALEAIIDYAENEAYSLEKLKDCPEAEAEAERAWKAVETGRDAIAQAKEAGIASSPPDIDIHALLAQRRQIADIWSSEDVQEIRPGLTDEQAWQVLQETERYHDATIGINWDVLSCHANMLFGNAPETDAAEEE